MSERRWWHRLRLTAGPTAVAVSGALTQQERLEGQEAFSATIRVAGTPDATEGDAVDLYLVDLAAATGKGQLLGQVDEILGTSYPHEQLWVCTDVMAQLRRVRSSDLDLTGMTDGEAVEAALTFAGVSYTASDIADMGYVLGQKAPVVWLTNVSAAEIIAEIDRVMQCRTMSVGAGRVCRVRYTLAPDAADAVAAYTRGNATIASYYFAGQRNRGRLDEIRNVVDVRGVSYECDDGGAVATDGACSCVVWAHAEADHPLLGAGVRARTFEFSSEIIQDTGLAEEVARDLMARYNRPQDRVRVRTENDPNVTVGKVITVEDAAAAIGLESPAPYTVIFIDRVGNAMTLEAIGGAAGASGTVTSGIEQVCQDASFDLPETPSFSLPDFGAFPAVPVISVPDIPTGGGEEGGEEEEDPCDGKHSGELADCRLDGGGTDVPIVELTSWDDDGLGGSFSESTGDLRVIASSDPVSIYWETPFAGAGDSWRVTFVGEGETDDTEWQLGVSSPGFSGPESVSVITWGSSFANPTAEFWANGDTIDQQPSDFDGNGPEFTLEITYDADENVASFRLMQGSATPLWADSLSDVVITEDLHVWVFANFGILRLSRIVTEIL